MRIIARSKRAHQNLTTEEIGRVGSIDFTLPLFSDTLQVFMRNIVLIGFHNFREIDKYNDHCFRFSLIGCFVLTWRIAAVYLGNICCVITKYLFSLEIDPGTILPENYSLCYLFMIGTDSGNGTICHKLELLSAYMVTYFEVSNADNFFHSFIQ